MAWPAYHDMITQMMFSSALCCQRKIAKKYEELKALLMPWVNDTELMTPELKGKVKELISYSESSPPASPEALMNRLGALALDLEKSAEFRHAAGELRWICDELSRHFIPKSEAVLKNRLREHLQSGGGDAVLETEESIKTFEKLAAYNESWQAWASTK